MIKFVIAVEHQDLALFLIVPAVIIFFSGLTTHFQHLLLDQGVYLVTGNQVSAAAHFLGEGWSSDRNCCNKQ